MVYMQQVEKTFVPVGSLGTLTGENLHFDLLLNYKKKYSFERLLHCAIYIISTYTLAY